MYLYDSKDMYQYNSDMRGSLVVEQCQQESSRCLIFNYDARDRRLSRLIVVCNTQRARLYQMNDICLYNMSYVYKTAHDEMGNV
jgi:hypothetical protein